MFDGALVVTYGDMPLVTARLLSAARGRRRSRRGMAIVAFRPTDPGAYGRVILDRDGFLDRIVEYKDAREEERAVSLCNAGIMAAEAQELLPLGGASWRTTTRSANSI